MPVISCPKCNHSALWIKDEVLNSKRDGDPLVARDFKVILSWQEQNFQQPQTGDKIACHLCGENMMRAIQAAFRRMKQEREREWDL
jgi:hypothetical protein